MTTTQWLDRDLYNAHRYLACARRWRERGDTRAWHIYMSRARAARLRYATRA